jgi:hypothetical protein
MQHKTQHMVEVRDQEHLAFRHTVMPQGREDSLQTFENSNCLRASAAWDPGAKFSIFKKNALACLPFFPHITSESQASAGRPYLDELARERREAALGTRGPVPEHHVAARGDAVREAVLTGGAF